MARLFAGLAAKGAELIDPTTLHTLAERILAVLEDAAEEIDWSPPRHCVTAGTPSLDCDSIFVWPDNLSPITDQTFGCQVVHRVRFQYVVATCVGTNRQQTCQDWERGAPASHDKAWYLQTALIAAGLGGGLCADPCTTLRWGDFTLLTNDGGYSWWQGSLQIDLSPEELAS